LTVHKTQSLLTLTAAAGLTVLTLVTAVRPSPEGQAWQVATIVLGWVAILANALDHRHEDAPPAERDAPDHPPPPPSPLPSPPPSPPPSPRVARAGEVSPATTDWMLGGRALVEFARELHGTLQSDRLHHLIARRLPALVGRRDVWVVARFGARQHIIVPSEAHGGPPTRLTDDIRHWVTFPMKVEGQPIGVLGVGLQAGGLSEREHRVLALVAELVGQSLATVNAFELMREASLVDLLTGCVTRPEGLRRFEAELRRADRTGTSLAVLMLDLDHFKNVNDRFGHNTGDAVLSTIGEMLLKTLRASDIRCRWGGEEFLLVLPDSTVERARRACEALRHRIATTPVRTSGHTVQVTASIGITLTQPGEADIQKLLARADAALYQAKRQGRNRIEFSPGTGDAVAAPFNPGRGTPPARPVAVDSAERRPERRDPSRPDRRSVPSPGRRRTDPGVAAEPWRA
jgi:diguanylate cyclase (GGDEF)-like protein